MSEAEIDEMMGKVTHALDETYATVGN